MGSQGSTLSWSAAGGLFCVWWKVRGRAYCLCSSQALQASPTRRSSLILQLGHWSPSGPQNKPSNTHRLQETKADKDTYGDRLTRNYGNQLKSYGDQEVTQGVICKPANRKGGSIQTRGPGHPCSQSEGLSQECGVGSLSQVQ